MERFLPCILILTLSIPVLLLNSPNLFLYFLLNKFERILLLIFCSLLCLINSQFLIAKCFILYVLCKEKLGVDNRLGLKGLITVQMINSKILSNLFNRKYRNKLGELKNLSGIERVKDP